MEQTKTERLRALDVMRGITVAGMILVNNPGDWGNVYAPLLHSSWNGLTPTDLVFPFFMFVMGAAMSFSFSKYGYRFSASFARKLVRRTCVLFLLGVFISWFYLVLSGLLYSDAPLLSVLSPFHEVRILGVLQRLALTYCLGSLLVVSLPSVRRLWTVCVGLLAFYGLLLFVGDGFSLSPSNLIAVVDNRLLGASHLYTEYLPDGTAVKFDPEGLLSTLPGIAHVVIGYLCGEMLRDSNSLSGKMTNLFVTGFLLLAAGYLLSYGCPINKAVWSPTFVLVTCGAAALLLALLVWVIDYRHADGWIKPFTAFGCNPLFLYVGSELGAILLMIGGTGGKVYAAFLSLTGGAAMFASLLYALLYVALFGALALFFQKKRIFIKI